MSTPSEFESLQELVKNPRPVPEPLVDETLPDPFVLRLDERSPGGARTAGLWLVATTNDQPFAFRLYRFVGGSWVPHRVDGQHRAIFPEGKLPAWWNAGERDPLSPDLPRDLVVARSPFAKRPRQRHKPVGRFVTAYSGERKWLNPRRWVQRKKKRRLCRRG